MAGSFENKINRFGLETLEAVDKVRRASMLELFKLIIYASPVDTGRLRGNWQTSVNAQATGEKMAVDPSGGLALAEAMANLGGVLDTIWFTNNLPYADRIEYDGWSRQAPEGMMRVHVAKWQNIVKEKAAAFSS